MKNKAQKELKLLTRQEMEKLSTKNLLAYLKRMHQCHTNATWGEHVESGEVEADKVKPKVSKNSKEWKETYYAAKEILATREHVE